MAGGLNSAALSCWLIVWVYAVAMVELADGAKDTFHARVGPLRMSYCR